MNKKFSSLLVIIILLSVQALSLLHVTKYSFEKHEHGGKKCEICLSVDHNKLVNGNPAKLAIPSLLTFKIGLPKKKLSFSYKTQSFNPRAPPLFS
jgi:hypothetical protein